MACIDLEKAFDRVQKQKTGDSLMNNKLIGIIKNIYREKNYIMYKNMISIKFVPLEGLNNEPNPVDYIHGRYERLYT